MPCRFECRELMKTLVSCCFLVSLSFVPRMWWEFCVSVQLGCANNTQHCWATGCHTGMFVLNVSEFHKTCFPQLVFAATVFRCLLCVFLGHAVIDKQSGPRESRCRRLSHCRWRRDPSALGLHADKQPCYSA